MGRKKGDFAWSEPKATQVIQKRVKQFIGTDDGFSGLAAVSARNGYEFG
jgi:hypothetical protein